MVYAKFGGQTECIMGNSKIENNRRINNKRVYASVINTTTETNIGKFI